MEQKVKNFLEHILPGFSQYRYVLAVSGGMDSMFLGHLMLDLVDPSQLLVAHFNHRLRNQDSDLDENLVRHFAKTKSIRFVRAERTGEKTSEASLRNERLKFLEEVRTSYGFDFILLGHHLQDQLETFLMRLFRGTGLDGLSVIQPKNGCLVRPFLTCSKETIQEEVQRRGISYRNDSSNSDPKYFRNKIRIELLPQLEKIAGDYGGKEKWLSRLVPLFDEVSATQKLLNQQTKKRLEQGVAETPYWIRFSRSLYESFSNYEKRRALRSLIKKLQLEPLSHPELRRLMDHLDRLTKNAALPGLSVSYSCGFFYLRKYQRHTPKVKLDFEVSNRRVICSSLGLQVRLEKNMNDLEFRQSRPGDRLGSKKIKEYFLKKGIPRLERELVPVLAKKNSNEVVWVLTEESSLGVIEKLDFPFAVGPA